MHFGRQNLSESVPMEQKYGGLFFFLPGVGLMDGFMEALAELNSTGKFYF